LNLVSQLADRHRFGALAKRAQTFHFKSQRIDRVRESAHDAFVKEFRIRQFNARLFERDCMTGQIAAVDTRDIRRLQWLKTFGVVPVKKVTAKLAQLVEGGEGEFLSLQKLQRTDVAEIMRRDGGQKK